MHRRSRRCRSHTLTTVYRKADSWCLAVIGKCALPAPRPPIGRRRRPDVRERKRAELLQRANVDRALEIHHLFHGSPVVNPPATIELGLGTAVEAHALRVAHEL